MSLQKTGGEEFKLSRLVSFWNFPPSNFINTTVQNHHKSLVTNKKKIQQTDMTHNSVNRIGYHAQLKATYMET